MATADQDNPVLASGGTPEPHGPSAVALCAPHRVLPQDHPIRLLARALHNETDAGVKCKLIRAIAASGRAHIKKTQLHHSFAVTELSSLGLDSYPEGRFPPEVLQLYQDALLYHKARSASVKQKLAPEGEGPHNQTMNYGKAPKEPRKAGPRDEVAMSLMGLTLDEVYAAASPVLGVPEPDLRAKYGHLNPGLQVMNLRNRMRAKGGKP